MKTDFAEYGFEAEMGTDLVSSEMILGNLFENQWLDNQTDLIMFEQTYFNANVNIIILFRISFEHVSGGAYSGQLRRVSIWFSRNRFQFVSKSEALAHFYTFET